MYSKSIQNKIQNIYHSTTQMNTIYMNLLALGTKLTRQPVSGELRMQMTAAWGNQQSA